MKKIFLSLFILFLLFSCSFEPENNNIALSSLKFKDDSTELKIGESKTLYVDYSPSDATDVAIDYSVSAEGIVEISGMSKNGCVVTAVSAGSAILIAKSQGYTSYCEIKVSDDSLNVDPYIVLPYVSLELKRGERKTVIASLFGGSAADNSQFEWKTESDIISVEGVSNSCVIEARKYGVARVTAHHQKSQYDASFVVYVPENTKDLFYLTTESNVIKTYCDSPSPVTLEISNVGGTEGDNGLVVFDVVEGVENISIQPNNNLCTVTGIKTGRSVIKVSHIKAEEPLYITVIISQASGINYIKTNNDFFLMDGTETVDVIATLVGEYGSDVNTRYSYTVENPDIIGVEQSANYFRVTSIKDGKSRLIINNYYSDYEKEVLFIVENSQLKSSECYISVDKPVLQLEEGGEDVKVKVRLIGGNESDKNNFKYKVEDSSVAEVTAADGQVMAARSIDVEMPDMYETEILVSPKHCGVTKVQVSNSKTVYNSSITVKVFPKGTFNSSDVYISGIPYVKLLVGETFDYECSLSENGTGIFELDWECSNPEILSVTSNETKGIFTAKSKGIANVKISSPLVHNTLNCAVLVCDTQEELEAGNLIYVDNTYPEVELDNMSYMELKTLKDVDYSKYNISVNEEAVVNARISGNTLILLGKNEGRTEVLVTHEDIPGFSLIVYVSVINSEVDIIYPYVITSDNFVNVLKGSTADFKISLGSAPAKEYSNIEVQVENEEVCSYNLRNNFVTLDGLNEGQTRVRLSHPRCKESRIVYVYVAATQEELDSKVILYTDKTNFITSVGEKLSLDIVCNRQDQINRLEWAVSDTEKTDIEVFGSTAVVTAKKEGFSEIAVTHPSGFCLKFFITIKDKKADGDKAEIKLPSIIELLTEQPSVLKMEYKNIDNLTVNNTEWESDSSILTVKGNGPECYILPNEKGSCNLHVSNRELNYSKNIVVNICDKVTDFQNSYVIGTPQSVYSINKFDILDVSLIFGKNDLPEVYYDDFIWETENKDIVSLTANGKDCSIRGTEAGTATIKVSNRHCVNTYSFIVNVKSDNNDKNISFVTEKIIKMEQGETGTYNFSLINSADGTEVTQFADVEIASVSNNNIDISLVAGVIRINAKEKGSAVVKLYSRRYQIETSFIVFVGTREELDNSFIVTSLYDHYLLKNNQEVKIDLITESENEEEIRNLSWIASDTSVIDMNVSEDRKSCVIKGRKSGSCTISVNSRNSVYNIYVSVTDYSFDSGEDFRTESVINMITGSTYKSHVMGKDYISLNEYDQNIIDVDLYQNLLTINALKSGTTEIKLGNRQQYAVIVNVFDTMQELEAHGCMNIDKRYYSISMGETVTLKPLYVPSKYESQLTFAEDIYQNNVVDISRDNGYFHIKGMNPGIARIRIGNSELNSFIINVEVSEEVENSRPEVNLNYYLYTNENPVYLDSRNNEKVLLSYVSGEGNFPGNNDFEWHCSDESLININPQMNACSISAKKAKGECYITCSNIFANNILNYKVIVGESYIDEGVSTKYISCSRQTVAMDYDSEPQIVKISINNMGESSVKDISLSDSRTNIVDFYGYAEGNNYFVELKPLSCGSGRITVKHPDAEVNSYIDYIVNDNEQSDIIYLTTADNISVVRPGEYKTLNAELKNYRETNSEIFKWKNENTDICSLMGNGPQVELYGIKEGRAKITVSHPKAKNTLSFDVTVTKSDTDIKYITTSSNIIETQVSQLMDSFTVSMIGDSTIDSSFEYKVSDPSVVSIVGNNNVCYYRGLKKGSAQITVTNRADASIVPLSVSVIVEDVNSSEGFLTSDSTINYLSPFGSSRAVNVSVNNVSSPDTSKLSWFIYSQTLASNAEGNVIELTASGSRGVIRPKNEGVAKIRVVYTPLNIKMNIMVYVSSFGTIDFVDDSITMFTGETQFANINLPSFSDNMGDFITYSSDNPENCSVFGSAKVACITGLKAGTTVVKAHNSYDDSVAELVVKVMDESGTNCPKINVNQSCFLLNPRAEKQTIMGNLVGPGVTDDDQSQLCWTVTGNPSVSVYPDKGPEVILSLKKVNGMVEEGIATINVTHPKCQDGYKKTIFVSVEELQNYFTLDSYSATVDTDSSVIVNAEIAGASASDLDDVQWSIDSKRVENDGTVTEIARIMNNNGGSCTVLGLAEGTCTLTAFYQGDIQQCTISVKGDRYFTLVNNSLNMYPGQEFVLNYNLRPATYTPTWYSSDSYSSEKIIEFSADNENQTVTIRALKTGSVSLTGMVGGIGTVVCNIKVIYNPKLLDRSKTAGSVFIPLYDRETDKYKETGNSKTIEFLCYPPIYYVKAEVESDRGFQDRIGVEVVQNHNREELDPKAGVGTLTIHSFGEVPNDDIVVKLQQYTDKECRKPIDENIITFKVNSYYLDQNGKKDTGFELYFKRNDGSFTFDSVNPNYRDMIKLFDTDNCRVNPDGSFVANKIDWGESETHFIVFKPKHEGQYFEDLEISTTSEIIRTDSSCDPKTTDIKLSASPFNYEKSNFVSIVNTGINCDVGYDVMYVPEKNMITVPKKSSPQFYSRFAVRKPHWNNMEPVSSNEYFPTEVYSGYYNGNWISYGGNVLRIGPNSGWAAHFDDRDWSETIFCLKDSDARFYMDQREFAHNSASLTSSGHLNIAAYIYNGNIKRAFYTPGGHNFQIHNGRKDYGKCTGSFLTHWGYHYYWSNSKSNYHVNVKLDNNFTVYNSVHSFPYNFSLFSMWKDPAWIDSGNGKCLPNINRNPLGNAKLNGEIVINYTDINGVKNNLIIPSQIRIYDCYRRLHKYDIRTNVFMNEEDLSAANPKFIKIK